MPLLITRIPAMETQADMTISFKEGIPPASPRERKFLSWLRRKPKEKHRDVYFRDASALSGTEKDYTEALEYALSRGMRTVAVSCDQEFLFRLADRCGRSYARRGDLQIILCIGRDVILSGPNVRILKECLTEKKPPAPKFHAADPGDFRAPLGAASVERELRDRDAAPASRRPCPPMQKEDFQPSPPPPAPLPKKKASAARNQFGALQEYLRKNDAGFKDTLLKYIDRTGRKDSEIYKKANVDRRLFSKIMNVQGYNPSKPTAIAFAIALELNLEETKDLISRAGYTLSRASTFDRIIEFFILEGNYDIYEINEALFHFDQSLLGC